MDSQPIGAAVGVWEARAPAPAPPHLAVPAATAAQWAQPQVRELLQAQEVKAWTQGQVLALVRVRPQAWVRAPALVVLAAWVGRQEVEAQ